MGVKLLTEGLLAEEVASVNANTYPQGLAINNQITPSTLATRLSTGNNVVLSYPFQPKANFRPQSISVEVTTSGGGGAVAQVYLFETERNSQLFLPNKQVFNCLFNTGTTGEKILTLVNKKTVEINLNSLIIRSDTLYWWTIYYVGTLRAIPIANTMALGYASATVVGNHYTGLLTQSSATADTFTDLTPTITLASGVLPSIKFVTAAI